MSTVVKGKDQNMKPFVEARRRLCVSYKLNYLPSVFDILLQLLCDKNIKKCYIIL